LSRRPVITDETPIGPDVDLDAEEILLADGTRLTNEMIPALVEEIRQATERIREGADRPSGFTPEEEQVIIRAAEVLERRKRKSADRRDQTG
jgi:hypothetical protein